MHRRRHQVRIVQGHQRRLPDLEEHRHRRARCIGFLQLIEFCAKFHGSRLAYRIGTRQRRQTFERTRHCGKIARLAFEHGDAERAQARQLCSRATAAPAHHQIRFQTDDPLQVERCRATDRGDFFRFGRVIAELADADDAASRSGSKQQFGRMRCQADDAHGWRRQSNQIAGIVGCADGCGMHRRGRHHCRCQQHHRCPCVP